MSTIIDESFDDVLTLLFEWIICVCLGHAQRLAFAFVEGLIDVDDSTINDFAFGSIDDDVLSFLLVVFIFEYFVDIVFFCL